MSNLQAAFFFGSGISIPSGMPSVQKITAAVHDDECHFTTARIFMPGPNTDPAFQDTVTPVVKAFLATISDYAAEYLAEVARPNPGRKPNYEDLYSLAEQAMRVESDYVPNLAAVEFYARLRRDTAPLHCGFKGGSDGGVGFVGLTATACDFLHWAVYRALHPEGAERRGLQFISETASNVAALDVFTLNHDLLVETQLKSDGHPNVESGFDDRSQGEFSVYRPGWWHDSKQVRQNVRIFKLHGSLDYWLYQFSDGARLYAIPDAEPFHSRDQNGRLVRPVEWKPAFLSGTAVKEFRYNSGIWDDVFAAFRSHLASHTHLICCGYGFGDTGINQRLQQWMQNRRDGSNRLVVLTPKDPAAYLTDKPCWLCQLWRQERVIFVQKYLEECTINDLSPYFDPLA